MDLPSNSSKSKGDAEKSGKPEKDVQKVVTGGVIQRPPTLGRRFKNIFFGGGAKGATNYVVHDVLLPALKNMFVDAVDQGARRMVYGDAAPRRRSILEDRYGSRTRISYNEPVNRSGRRSDPAMLPQQPPRYSQSSLSNIGDIILQTREDAEDVMEQMRNIIEVYDVASVADLHQTLGLASTHVDNKWGWTTTRGFGIQQIREGFLLIFPQLEDLDRL